MFLFMFYLLEKNLAATCAIKLDSRVEFHQRVRKHCFCGPFGSQLSHSALGEDHPRQFPSSYASAFSEDVHKPWGKCCQVPLLLQGFSFYASGGSSIISSAMTRYHSVCWPLVILVTVTQAELRFYASGCYYVK